MLKPESLAAMTQPAHLNNGKLTSTSYPVPPRGASEYGFGLSLGMLGGKRTIGHTGAINGFRAWVMTLPDEKLTVVMLLNSEPSGNVRERMMDAAVALGQAKR